MPERQVRDSENLIIRKRTFATIAAIAAMLIAFACVVAGRQHLRAWWWARALATATEPGAMARYAGRLAAEGDAAMGAIGGLLDHSRQDVRMFAVLCAANIGSPAAIDALVRAMGDADAEVRLTAGTQIGIRFGSPARERLQWLAAARPRDRAMAAVVALERSTDPAATADLCAIAGAATIDTTVRAQAADSLGRRGDAVAVPALTALLGVRDPISPPLLNEIRDEIATRRIAAIQGAGGPTGRRDDSIASLADAAAGALRQITGRDCGYHAGLSDAQLAEVTECFRAGAATKASDDGG